MNYIKYDLTVFGPDDKRKVFAEQAAGWMQRLEKHAAVLDVAVDVAEDFIMLTGTIGAFQPPCDWLRSMSAALPSLEFKSTWDAGEINIHEDFTYIGGECRSAEHNIIRQSEWQKGKTFIGGPK